MEISNPAFSSLTCYQSTTTSVPGYGARIAASTRRLQHCLPVSFFQTHLRTLGPLLLRPVTAICPSRRRWELARSRRDSPTGHGAGLRVTAVSPAMPGGVVCSARARACSPMRSSTCISDEVS